MTDRLRRVKGEWKAITLDYDFVRSLSEDRCLYCLSKQEASILLATIEQMRFPTRWWRNADDTIDRDWLENTVDRIVEELMTDHCDIDATLTQIQNDIITINTNITAIQNNVTINIYDTSVVNNYQDKILIELALQALQSLSCELPGKAWLDKEDDGSDTAAYAAYCALVTEGIRWIRTVLYRFIYVTDPEETALAALYDALLDAGGYFTGTVFDNAGIPTPPSQAAAVAAAEDDAAIQTVACDLALALAARSLAFTDWQSAVFTLTTYADPSNEKVIADLLIAAATLDNILQVNYAGWIAEYPTMYEKAYAAAPTSFDDCGCGLSTCVAASVDFAVGEKLPFIVNRGKYAPGSGIIATLLSGDGSNYGIDVSLRFPANTCQIDVVTVSGLITGGGAGGNRAWVEWYHDVAGVETLYNQSGLSSNGLEQTWTLTNPTQSNYVTRLRFRTNSAFYGTSPQTITWAIFRDATITPV